MIFDDYYHNFRFSFLLQLLDKYPIRVPVKSAFTKFNSGVVIFTSNIPLEEQYPNIPDKESLRRRFTSVVHFDNTFVSDVNN